MFYSTARRRENNASYCEGGEAQEVFLERVGEDEPRDSERVDVEAAVRGGEEFVEPRVGDFGEVETAVVVFAGVRR